MLVCGEFHQNVVRLIKDVGTIAERSVQREVGVGVHIGVHRHDAVLGIRLVECVEQLVKIADGDRGVVLQHPYRDIAFDLSVEFGESLRAVILPEVGKVARRDRERGEAEQHHETCRKRDGFDLHSHLL